MAMAMAQTAPPRDRIRWRWVIGCFGIGLVCWGGAYFTEARYGWIGVSPELMLHIGTALGLAGFIFVLERRFSASVRVQTERLVQDVETRLEARTDALATRLDQLGEQYLSGLAQAASEQDQRIAALHDDVSFETVTAAIEATNDIRALAHGYPIVDASADPDGLALEFRWVQQFDQRGQSAVRFDIVARIEADSGMSGGRPHVQVEWRPDQPARDVGVSLATRLQTANRWNGPETLAWDLAIENLMRTLSVATKATRHDPDGWALHGPVFELVGDGWALTEAGVERPDQGYLLPDTAFPGHTFLPRNRPEFHPPKPEWADPAEWDRVIRRAKPLFPRERGPASMAPDWRPMTTALRRELSRDPL